MKFKFACMFLIGRADFRVNHQFRDNGFVHLNGSHCCAPLVNTTSVASLDECGMRCRAVEECKQWVLQPSTGFCWVGKPTDEFLMIPVADRIAGTIAPINQTVYHRNEFFPLITELYHGGLGVVLGVGRGDMVKRILAQWNGGLYLVDPYIHIWKGYDDPVHNVDDQTHQIIYENLRTNLHQNFDNRFIFVRDFSYSLAPIWQSKFMPSPSFVFIDNIPTFDAVDRDLVAWWEMVSPGGIMAGFHYTDPNLNVNSAVDTFFAKISVIVHITTFEHNNPIWFVIKPLEYEPLPAKLIY